MSDHERLTQVQQEYLSKKERLPLLHYTRASVAIRALHDGLFSYALAQRLGEGEGFRTNFQTQNAISVTDLEKARRQYQEEGKELTDEELLSLSIGLSQEEATVYHRDGICLFLKPTIKTYDQGNDRKNSIGHGNWNGEVAAHLRIAPREITGVMITRFYEQDAHILEEIKGKRFEETATDALHPVRAFENVTNILRALEAFSEAEQQQIAQAVILYKEFRKTDSIVNPSQTSFGYMMRKHILQNLGQEEAWLSEYERSGKGLNDFQYKEVKSYLTHKAKYEHVRQQFLSTMEVLQQHFIKKLEAVFADLNIPRTMTYAELLVLLAKQKDIPVFNSAGTQL